MRRVTNFSAGPSTLPYSVLKKAQAEFTSYQNTGLSILEMSHRSKHFEEILFDTKQLLQKLMNIPNNYQVLFLQGGASLQFSMVPLNLFHRTNHAYYAHTGTWSEKAIQEARKMGEVTMISSSEDKAFTYIPPIHLPNHPSADYIHITTNNTIEGTRYDTIPNEFDIPLVADMSSNILSEVYDVTKFGLIYAGAQKNIGPAGLTIVIIRDDLIGKAPQNCPTMLDYSTYVKTKSLYNTPPTFSIYMTKLVLEWLQKQGGVEGIEKVNKEKARLLYSFLDHSPLFHSKVEPKFRSIMNIPFTTYNAELDQLFIQTALEHDFLELQGHRSTGGMRASLYNAMSIESVRKLVDFMKLFEQSYLLEGNYVSNKDL
ncbi:3-phosphoserine/phosphohydroxythreonine transaminase [Bacillus suaedaesalsae]|uniref:Phosphoserine aminotransferase n=1 Tax=Bacillus suaedaesalsae TaxID=2810349 RepID=A0ABS2DMA3_9BACI|nr:3-phosphoserine/phosphohydroxythreonine transaminase [Bacillus suaedaesalsae]MBM6619626.1 3-phosphoserine/phosphohydroxythreonine transaminase [Bacillus suaedaesalsae]